jgi:hypothetical protein
MCLSVVTRSDNLMHGFFIVFVMIAFLDSSFESLEKIGSVKRATHKLEPRHQVV